VQSYFTWEEDDSFIDGIEFVVSDRSGKYYEKNGIIEIVGTLKAYEKFEKDDTQTGDKSVIRIQVESSSITRGVSGWGFTSR
jgi:hypothetical protein